MEDNTSLTPIFVLSGMKHLTPKYLFVFLSLSVYLLIILLNLMLIVTILLEKSLHEPMYLFVCNLCFNGLYGTTGFYPKFIYDLLSPSPVISYVGCFTQSFVIYSSFTCEFTILVTMAYDRYVAICRPLEYHNILRTQTVAKAILYSWAFPFLLLLPHLVLTVQLPLCGSSIDRLYCDNWSIVKQSCIPTTTINALSFTLLLIVMAHAFIVMFSYQRLIVACRNSSDNKRKFIHTCGPHLVSLMNFSIALLFDIIFSRYGSEDFPEHLRNAFQVEILVIPPIVNPLIYGLKLSEIRKRLFQKSQKQKKTRLAFCRSK
ncbi:olfactory receptor 142-like [Colossoma macropomum]|uniref:olfactory receptor 142-like n=1 Tax=Colossoma macropomum TaxID=42526 RepID=UPI001864F179|nr:olfactory receptor 142-like [Colossoma macropomum]